MTRVALALALLLLPSSAFAQGLLECDLHPMGLLLEDLHNAATAMEQPQARAVNPRYTALEREVIAALGTMHAAGCGPTLLGASLLDAATTKPGFAQGREKAYTEALEILNEYGYAFIDEDSWSHARDRADPSASRVDKRNIAKWSVPEIKRIRALLRAMGPAGKKLPLHAFVRDDTYRWREIGDPKVLAEPDVLGWYWKGELRMFDSSTSVDDLYYMHTVYHELVHSYVMDRPDIQAIKPDLYKALGWEKNGTKDFKEIYYSCLGAEDNSWADGRVVWKPPPGYDTDPDTRKYHETEPGEDIPERITFDALGPLIIGSSSEESWDELSSQWPDDRPAVTRVLHDKLSDMAPLLTAPPKREGVVLTRTTTAEVAQARGDADEIYEDGSFELHYWLPNARATSYDFAAVFRDGRAIAVSTNVRDQNLRRADLTRRFGKPTYRDPDTGSYVWLNRLLSVSFDSAGFAETAHYGFRIVDPLTP